MKYFLILLIFGFCYVVFLPFQIIVKNPVNVIKYGITDIYHYFKYNLRYNLDGGTLNCYVAHFGGGKTLSVVEYITHLYKKYNNRTIYDIKKKAWLHQRILILSNVDLSVPYQKLESLSQIVDCANHNKAIDDKFGSKTVVLVLLDEASSQLNSRNFKSNINVEFLNTLITCRHYHINFYYTSQKFKLTDALLRSVTQNVIVCKKTWRLLCQYTFNADEVELVGDPSLLKPKAKFGLFVTDKIYNLYDTLATVEELGKKFDSNDYLTEEEIIKNRQILFSGQLNPDSLKKKYKAKK